MSTLKLNSVQIGQSVTATNNFTLYQPTVPDGTVRIGNGNAGAATDRITIDASGNISPGVTNTQTLGIPGDVWSNVYSTTFTESVFAVTGTTPALSPTNGSIQTWTLTASSTPTAGTWEAGQSMTLMIDDGTAFTITWTSLAVTWKTDAGLAPTLNTSGYTAIALWKVGTTIYGARVGDS